MIFEITDGEGRITESNDICESLNFDGVPLNLLYYEQHEEAEYISFYNFPLNTVYYQEICTRTKGFRKSNNLSPKEFINELRPLLKLFTNGIYSIEHNNTLKHSTSLTKRVSHGIDLFETLITRRIKKNEETEVLNIAILEYDGTEYLYSNLLSTIPKEDLHIEKQRDLENEIKKGKRPGILLYKSGLVSEYLIDSENRHYHILTGHNALFAYEKLNITPNIYIISKTGQESINEPTNIEFVSNHLSILSLKNILHEVLRSPENFPNICSQPGFDKEIIKEIRKDFNQKKAEEQKRIQVYAEKRKQERQQAMHKYDKLERNRFNPFFEYSKMNKFLFNTIIGKSIIILIIWSLTWLFVTRVLVR